MTAPTAMTILQLVAPVAAAALIGCTLLLARTVENGRDSRASRKSRRAAAAQSAPATPAEPRQSVS